MKKLFFFIFCLAVLAANGQRTPFNLQGLMTKEVMRKTTSIPQYKKWKLDQSIHSAFMNDSIEQLTDLFVRTAPDTVIILEHNTMNEWFVRVQYTHSDADAASYSMDGTGKLLTKIRPYTGVVRGSDDGSQKVFKVVNEIDPYVSIDHTTQVLSSSEEGKNLQREVDELLSKF